MQSLVARWMGKLVLSDDALKFFIVGCGRSGTTLVRRLLHDRADVAIPPESLFLADYLDISAGWSEVVAKKIFRYEGELKEWKLEREAIGLALRNNTLRTAIVRIHEEYAQAHNAPVSGQKTPRLVRYGSKLHKYFPNAKFLEVIRDPRAVVASLKKSEVHNSNALYGALRWRRDIKAGEHLRNVVGTSHQLLYYENLINDVNHEIDLVIQFLSLNKRNAIEHAADNVHSNRYYSSVHKLVDGPVEKARLEGWRSDLCFREQMLVEAICGSRMRQHGYCRETETLWWVVPYAMILALQAPLIILRQISHSLRYRPHFLPFFLLRKIVFRLLNVKWRKK